MSRKLLRRRISKYKYQSMYIVARPKENLKVHKILLIWITPICKVTMTKTNLFHEHMAKGSTHAPWVKPGVIHIYLNKSL